MSGLVVRTTGLAVMPDGEDLNSEMATILNIADEGAGEYVEVRQSVHNSVLRIDPDEWQALRGAIDRLIAECRGGA